MLMRPSSPCRWRADKIREQHALGSAPRYRMESGLRRGCPFPTRASRCRDDELVQKSDWQYSVRIVHITNNSIIMAKRGRIDSLLRLPERACPIFATCIRILWSQLADLVFFLVIGGASNSRRFDGGMGPVRQSLGPAVA